MKNITLSADEHLLAAAHKYATLENTTLDAEFQKWLADYIEIQRQADRAMATTRELQGKISTDDCKFTRDEMNER